MTDYVVDLNTLNKDGDVDCPYCLKKISYSYGASGKQSCQCGNCHRYVLIDYDKMRAYKVRPRKNDS
jgi:hypothetical protein